MAFPTVQGTPTETAVSTAGTSHAIALPGSIAAGELLLILCNKGVAVATFNALTGWTELVDENVANGMTVWVRDADGTEGATVTFTSNAATRSASIAYRISGATTIAAQLPELSTVAAGSSVNPNATTCTPTGGAKDYLWFSFFGMATETTDNDAWVSQLPQTPSAFSSLRQKTCGTAGTNLGGLLAVGQLNSNAASLDAGAFTSSINAAWRAFTLAIHPGLPAITGAGSAAIVFDRTADGITPIAGIADKPLALTGNADGSGLIIGSGNAAIMFGAEASGGGPIVGASGLTSASGCIVP